MQFEVTQFEITQFEIAKSIWVPPVESPPWKDHETFKAFCQQQMQYIVDYLKQQEPNIDLKKVEIKGPQDLGEDGKVGITVEYLNPDHTKWVLVNILR